MTAPRCGKRSSPAARSRTRKSGSALEVLDAGVTGGPDGDYPMFAAEVDGRFAGYVCVGQTPLTHSTWHLYWICVHPGVQGRGVGRALQAHAEAFVQSRGGERIVLETSATRQLCPGARVLRRGRLRHRRRIPDFYRPGDDCLIYCRAFPLATPTP